MKVRNGFVSKSSSSSFVINKYELSQRQIDQIENHAEVSGGLICPRGDWGDTELCPWDINIDESTVCGFTICDNFNMKQFLIAIGVRQNAVRWDNY